MTGSRVLVLACSLLCILVACSPRSEPTPQREVRVQLDWTHQAQWAGFYAAEKNGYYSAESLSVSLIPRTDPTIDALSDIADGKAQFGTTNGIVAGAARSRGIPILAIAAIYRRNAQVFMTLSGSGISSPQDFAGRTIRSMSLEDAVISSAMMKRVGLDPATVEQVDAGHDMTPFFEGQIDIWPGSLTDEVLYVREQGYNINVILPQYYGVHQYGMVLITSDMYAQEEPELVTRFLRATLKGWQWAIENPEDAALLSLEYDPSLSPGREIELLRASVPLIHTGEDQIGWMRPDVWQSTAEMLVEQDILSAPVGLDQLYTVEFLNQVYGTER